MTRSQLSCYIFLYCHEYQASCRNVTVTETFNSQDIGISSAICPFFKKLFKIERFLNNVPFRFLTSDKTNDELKFGSTSVPGAETLFEKQLNETVSFAKAVNCKK